MGRIFLILLAAVFVVAISPPLRSRVEPHAGFVLDPFYRWSATNRVTELRKLVEGEKSLGRSIPAPTHFVRFVSERDPASGPIDPWGNAYYLETTRHTYRVASAGPDGVQRTADDIYSAPGNK